MYETKLYYFTAEWCQPCRQFGPVIEGIAKEDSRFKFIKVDIDKDPPAWTTITSVPTLILVKHGQIEWSLSGAKPKNFVVEQLDKHL
jgi:thioredoxin 1